ncbi:monocarboxylate transporter 1-like isoform X1 [Lytechinus variegatus]|uniref:monocarboxylate transporter 1-like isoform X1 n=1 Tax=Lytechinus variegatus TaxID=7654 RepID=UPI001BB2AF0F|nr:monocarboxylate transporter 1-like isoform X1 [Lytechinus variegatus]
MRSMSNTRLSTWRKIAFIAAFFFIGFIEMGVVKSFGVIIAEIVFQMNSDLWTVGFIFGAYNGLTYLLGPFILPTIKYLSLKQSSAIGIIGGLCLAASSFTSNIAQLATCFVISGVSFSFVLAVALIQFNTFISPEDFALYFGITDTGAPIGMILLPILAEFLKETYGWRGCMLLLGGIFLYAPASLLVMAGRREDLGDTSERLHVDERDNNSNGGNDVNLQAEQGSSIDLLEGPSYQEMEDQVSGSQQAKKAQSQDVVSAIRHVWRFVSDFFGLSLFTEVSSLFTFCLFQLSGGLIITAWVVFLIPHGVAKGFPLSRAVFLASIGGIGNILGRLGQGPIIYHKWLSSSSLTFICAFINACVLLIDPLIDSYPVLAAATFVNGFTLGARTTVLVVLTKEILPVDNFATGYGLVALFYGLGQPLGGLLAGWLSGTFSYSIAFMFLGGLEIMGTIFLLPTRYALKQRSDREEL